MKVGMVCEGGANRTVFSCGAWDVFLDEGIMPDYFIGVSAGIAFGGSYLSRQKGRNLRLAEEYIPDKRYMGARHLFNKDEKTYYSTDFVFDDVPNVLLPYDYEELQKFEGEIEEVVTNIHTGEAEYLELPRDEGMKDYLVASCAMPVLFQPVRIGKHYYLDGGVADSVPFEHALEKGCDKVIVMLTRARDYVKKKEPATKVASGIYKDYPKLVEAMESRADRYNASMERLRELENEGRAFVFAPESTFGVGRTESDPVKLRLLYDEGYRLAHERMAELRKYLEA